MKTHFVITRRTHWWMNRLPLRVYLDDIELGSLYNNEYLEYTLVQHEQYVHVAVGSWGFFKRKIDLHIKPTDRFDLTIVSNWNDVIKSLAFITVLLLLHFGFYHKNDEVRYILSAGILLYKLVGYGAVSFIDTRYDRTLVITKTPDGA
ncbi:hypothetical protein [Runella slithyformis]|uniref:Uncharacterized protein n=1 Tax=Runella slithyformis (strain ATCC 29530 / DSM 19594 / LMG 11500 / NCIMB 11436 / LSU 4) TaxID=761193 RepID=A0A7U3ZGN5_RUNSL|nr:hypothetical protein [Runella slithyformis]AEI46872.1 hypothetical protein Runsl_0422 [Runella slithyformis DSM 19594]